MTKGTKILLGVIGFVALLAVCVVTLVAYLFVSHTRGQAEVRSGYVALTAGSYDKAIRNFTSALERPLGASMRGYALACRGYCKAREQRNAEAVADLSKALRLNAKLAFAYVERGALRLANHADDDAWQDYSRAIAIDPNAAPALFARGTISARREHWDAAIRDFSEAIRSNPNDAVAYVWRGDAYGRLKDFDHALASFEAAIRTAPEYANGYLYRGYVYQERRNFHKAIADYSTAIRRAPDLADAYWARYRVFVEQKNWRGAIADCSELLRLNPRDELALGDRGLAYYAAGDDEPAIRDFTELIRLTQSRQAYELRAGTFTRAGRYRDALADYQTATQVFGEISSIKRLPWLLATCPDATFRRGDEAVTRALEDCTQTDWKNLSCIDTLAAAYAETGDFAQAVKYEEQVLASDEVSNTDIRAGFTTRLAMFKCGIPYRETRNALMPRHAPTPAPRRRAVEQPTR